MSVSTKIETGRKTPRVPTRKTQVETRTERLFSSYVKLDPNLSILDTGVPFHFDYRDSSVEKWKRSDRGPTLIDLIGRRLGIIR